MSAANSKGCPLILFSSGAMFLPGPTPLWHGRQFWSGVEKRISDCLVAAVCGTWQLAQPALATVVFVAAFLTAPLLGGFNRAANAAGNGSVELT